MASLSIPALMSESRPINIQLNYSSRFNRPAFKCTDPNKVCTNLHTDLINVTCTNSVKDPWARLMWVSVNYMTETSLKCHHIEYQTQCDDFHICLNTFKKSSECFLMFSNWGQQTHRGPKGGASFFFFRNVIKNAINK